MTRRVVEPQHLRVLGSPYHQEHPEIPDKTLLEKLCQPPCWPGDILYVRETWTTLIGPYIYKAGQKPGMQNSGKWHPSIHIPKEAARIFLLVTEVCAGQLRDMTEKDAKAEGFTSRAEAIQSILTMYKGCTEDSWFSLFCFILIKDFIKILNHSLC